MEEELVSQNGYAEGRSLFTSSAEQIRDIGFIEKNGESHSDVA